MIHEGGDIRSWFKVRKGKMESTLNGLPEVLPKGFAWEFPNISGEVVEWRGVLKGDVFLPHTIIFRVSGSDPSGKEPVTKSCLVVASLAADGTARLIGSAMGKDENDKAVALADKARSKQP